MQNYKLVVAGLLILLSACATNRLQRLKEKEKAVQSKGIYCEFVSEADANDVDTELNLRMAKRCEASKPFSITSHKRINENVGLVFCCNADPSSSSVEAVSGATEKMSEATKK